MRNRAFSTYKPPNKLKNAIVKLTPAEEELYRWKKECGYLDRHMLTISPPPGHRHMSAEWLQNIWKEAYIHYGGYHKQKLYFSTVVTHGPHGESPPSMHIVWQEYPKSLYYLVGWLKGKYVTAVTKPHKQGLRYWCKNCSEPEADARVGEWQLSKEKIRKRAEKKRKRRVI